MKKKTKEKIIKVFKSYPEIKLVYFFGSQASGNQGPLSDYDFAIYIEKQESEKKLADIKLELMDKIGDILSTNDIDIVVINTTKEPEMKYNIIKTGKLIVEKEPYKVLVEPKILRQYFDFKILLRKHNLTKSK